MVMDMTTPASAPALQRRATTANERISTNLRGILAERRLGRSELANVLHISPQSASRRLNGEHDFKLSEINAIADWLEIEPGSLIYG